MTEYTKRRSGSSCINADQKRREHQDRKRCILYLIYDYLKTHHLQSSYEALQKEAQISDQYAVCDNIDLEMIVQEYESYYNMKFQREPKIIRKTDRGETTTIKKPASATRIRKNVPQETGQKKENAIVKRDEEFQFEIITLESQENVTSSGDSIRKLSFELGREKKSLSDFPGYTPEWREMADHIIKEFVPTSLDISWTNCIGLEKPIELIKEATVYPIQYPSLFENLPSTWRGILLYGPPGTGKTLLAKALASEADTKLINVTSSTFISKWRGDSEKMIRTLFDLAKYYAPTTIFIDEIDAILSEPKDTNHEASCRFKSELLVQMDGILTSDETLVFLLATTNNPWKLDKALLRRFEKRILIPLPSETTKLEMLKHYASWLKNENEADAIEFVKLLNNFSGADIKNLTKEAEMRSIREQLKEMKLKNKVCRKRSTTFEDLTEAVKTMKPSINVEYYNKILGWHEKFGSS